MNDTIICSLPLFVCLFWSIFLLTHYIETRNKATGRLTVFMVVATVLYCGHYIFFTRMETLIPMSDVLYVGANLSVYPLYYLYVEGMTVKQKSKALGHWLLVLPPPFVAVCAWFAYQEMTPEETTQFIEQYLYQNTMEGLTGMAYIQGIIHTVAKVLFALQIIPILYFGNRNLQRFEQLIQTNYSTLESRAVKPVRLLHWLFAVTAFFSLLSNAIGRHQFTDSPSLIAIPSLLFSFFLYYIGYVGFRQKITILDVEREMELAEKQAADEAEEPDTSNEDNEAQLNLKERIEALVRGQQLYLRPNLKISDLTHILGSNRNYIYTAINVEMGLSFSDYVNKMRVEHAQQLLQLNPNALLTEVSQKSGFSSTVSFYRAFKKFVGCPPKEWAAE